MTHDPKNLDLWNKVEKSDPTHLKRVSFGQRSFTAIDPQYQIMMATEAFGPVGEGWGWDANIIYEHISTGEVIVLAEVVMWHGDRSNTYGPFPGCRTFVKLQKNGEFRIAEDAPKMAVTDGITKCLSHLGFNADVFLGKHDGNKYSDPNAKRDDSDF